MTTLAKTIVIARSEATRQSPDADARFLGLPSRVASRNDKRGNAKDDDDRGGLAA
jgi:hypothetical protein